MVLLSYRTPLEILSWESNSLANIQLISLAFLFLIRPHILAISGYSPQVPPARHPSPYPIYKIIHVIGIAHLITGRHIYIPPYRRLPKLLFESLTVTLQTVDILITCCHPIICTVISTAHSHHRHHTITDHEMVCGSIYASIS